MSGSRARAAAGPDKKPPPGSGGALSRLRGRRGSADAAPRPGAPWTESELLELETVRPEHVLGLCRVTESECGAMWEGGRPGAPGGRGGRCAVGSELWAAGSVRCALGATRARCSRAGRAARGARRSSACASAAAFGKLGGFFLFFPPPPPGTPRSAFLSPPFPFSLCTPAVCAFVPSSRILRGRGWSEVLSSSLQLFRGLLKRSSVFSSRLFMQTRGQHLQHRLHQVQDPRPGDGDGAV